MIQGEKMRNNPVNRAQYEIATILRGIKLFNDNRVEVVEQNSKALSYLLKRTIEQVRGLVCVVAVTSMDNNPPVLEAKVSVSFVENVTMNRIQPNYLTAIDAAMIAVEKIDGLDWNFQGMSQETSETGVVSCEVQFQGQMFRDSDDDEDVYVEPRTLQYESNWEKNNGLMAEVLVNEPDTMAEFIALFRTMVEVYYKNGLITRTDNFALNRDPSSMTGFIALYRKLMSLVGDPIGMEDKDYDNVDELIADTKKLIEDLCGTVKDATAEEG